MSVKYCKHCGAIFDEEDADLVDVGFWCEFWGHDVYNKEYELHCPDCGSEDIDDAEECEECRDYFTPDELDEDGLCPCCHEDKGD